MSSSTPVPSDPADSANQPKPLPMTLFNGDESTLQVSSIPVVTVSYKEPNGEVSSMHSILLPQEETDRMLTAGELSFASKSANLVADVNALASNEPMEDAWAFDNVQLDKLSDDNFWKSWQDAKSEDGDMVFASVFDGHRGYHIANICSRVVHACLARAIGKLVKRTPEEMKRVISETIEAIDTDLSCGPEATASGKLHIGKNDALPNPPPAFFGAIGLMDCRGACATTAIIDVTNGEMYVANLGDSRCVAGWKSGYEKWRCDTLTRDMTPDDPEECEEVYSLHPDEPKDELVTDVGTGRRLIGIIRVTRAYGDQYLKARGFDLNKQLQRTLGNPYSFKIKNAIACDQPPYMISKPDITHRSLRPESGEKLGFLVLAVDGVFDRLSSEEAALVMASHLSHPIYEDIPRAELDDLVSLKVTEPRPWPRAPLPGTDEYKPREVGHWVYEHQNAATHLIANSLAGAGDRAVRRQLLSLRGDAARCMRDDMTAIVLKFNDSP